jgi:hypothetical protein
MPKVMEIWEPKPPGTLWATPGLLRDCFTFTFYLQNMFNFMCDRKTDLQFTGDCDKNYDLIF